MKGSTLRCSLGSIQSSGSYAASPSRGIWHAILQARSETSNPATFAAPLSPATSRRHVGSTPQPSGVTMPRPVITTRRISPPAWTTPRRPGPRARPASRASGSVLLEELDRVADRHDRLGGIVRDLDVELLLERHHELHGVEAVGAKVVDEVGVF